MAEGTARVRPAQPKAPLLRALLVFPVAALVGCLAVLAIEGLIGVGGTFAENTPFWLALGLAPLATLWVCMERGLSPWPVALCTLGTLAVTAILLTALVLLLIAAASSAVSTIA